MNEDKGLHTFLFNIIVTLFEQENWEEEEYKNIFKHLASYMQVDFTAFYISFEKTKAYQLVDFSSKEFDYKPIHFLSQIENPIVKDFLDVPEIPEYSYTTSINLSTGEKYFIIIINKEPIPAGFLKELKEEIQNLLTIVHRMDERVYIERNNKFLLDLSMRLLHSTDRGEILHEITEAFESMYPEYNYHLLLTQEHDTYPDLPLKPLQYKEGELEDVSTEVFMSGELQVVVNEPGLNKTIFAPLLGEQSVYGVLEMEVPLEIYFSDQELSFITEFASLAGKSLETTILYEDSLMQVSNLTLLNDIIHELNTMSDLEEITSAMGNRISSLTKATEIGFINCDEELNGAANILIGSSSIFDTPDGKKLIKELINKLNADSEPVFSGDNKELEHLGFHSVLTVPLVNSGQNYGFAVILHEDKYHFTFESFKLIESLIQHAAVVISNTMLKEKLKRAVITDYLTKLYSRSYLEEQITAHIETGNSGVLILFDIDNFKDVNDQYGHSVGDEVLIQVATILKNNIPDTGISARWGGEELAIYLPECTLSPTIAIAEEIRKKIAFETNPGITVSCGIGVWSKGEEASQASLFIKADQALYDAKSRGKDQIVIA